MQQIPFPMTLLEALVHFYPTSSKRSLQQWIKEGRVSVDQEVTCKANAPLQIGQSLALGKKERHNFFYGIELLYQDRWLIAINKPIGLLSVPAESPEKSHALGLLREHFGTASIFPVHRIDRETSGVLLFARGTLAEKKLDVLFETHAIEREYIAVVEGKLMPEKGTWQSYLVEKENYDVVTTTAERGKLATTHYEVYRRSKKFSFLRLKLETGRKHQIRVHCKHAGYPILGDARYGSICDPIKRLCLHAHVLGFIHPFTGKTLRFVSPPPPIFKKLGIQ